MTVKVEGLRKFKRKFDKFPTAARVEIEAALDKGAHEILARAKQIIPVKTGATRDALEVRKTLDGFTASGAVGRAVTQSSRGSVARYIGAFPKTAGSPGMAAAFIEFGTAPRQAGQKYTQAGGKKRTAGNTHPGTPARPFLRPAFFSLQARAVNRVKRAINKAAKAVARG